MALDKKIKARKNFSSFLFLHHNVFKYMLISFLYLNHKKLISFFRSINIKIKCIIIIDFFRYDFSIY